MKHLSLDEQQIVIGIFEKCRSNGSVVLADKALSGELASALKSQAMFSLERYSENLVTIHKLAFAYDLPPRLTRSFIEALKPTQKDIETVMRAPATETLSVRITSVSAMNNKASRVEATLEEIEKLGLLSREKTEAARRDWRDNLMGGACLIKLEQVRDGQPSKARQNVVETFMERFRKTLRTPSGP